VPKFVVVRQRTVVYFEYFEVEAADAFEAPRRVTQPPNRATRISSRSTFCSGIFEGGLYDRDVLKLIRDYELRNGMRASL
jgi:hypothetical protein